MAYFQWRPYVSVAQRRAKAQKQMEKLRKKGKNIQPVEIEKRTIARSFWGKSWCEHLESFSDFSNRLPRGRTYARNGSVCHLEIKAGQIDAIVSGSELYNITIKIKPLKPAIWKAIKKQCSGQIGSMLELLQGKLSDHIMAIVTNQKEGLLPLPKQIELKCNCPDWAVMCKHVAAVLYGVGNRLDSQPELLFTLRGVDASELIAGDISLISPTASDGKTIADDKIADIFGVEMDDNSDKKSQSKTSTKKKQTIRKSKTVAKQEEFIPEKKVKKKKLVAKTNLQKTDKNAKLPKIRPTGKSVARLRNQLNISVPEFAKRLKVTPASIYRWEKNPGKLTLRPHTFKALAKLHQQANKK